MATPRQIESARINGARSRGPKTLEGKRRSALNALKHGLTSRTIPLDPESAAVLEQKIADYTADIRPTMPEETHLARRLAVSAFCIRHAWAPKPKSGAALSQPWLFAGTRQTGKSQFCKTNRTDPVPRTTSH
jgi:hypothetical protein